MSETAVMIDLTEPATLRPPAGVTSAAVQARGGRVACLIDPAAGWEDDTFVLCPPSEVVEGLTLTAREMRTARFTAQTPGASLIVHYVRGNHGLAS